MKTQWNKQCGRCGTKTDMRKLDSHGECPDCHSLRISEPMEETSDDRVRATLDQADLDARDYPDDD